MRNENVAINPIDNNAIKELNTRVGITPALITEPKVEQNYYAAEFGRSAAPASVLGAPSQFGAWHGEAYWNHQNHVFNARTFFQAGGVQPSRRNAWGGRASGMIGSRTALTLGWDQRDVRGMVNGNVLVPLENERTPLATDPQVREVVERFLNAYPPELPNRPDFDVRALNTNATQRIDDLTGTVRLDQEISEHHRLSASYMINRNRIDAFQLVDGQNPDDDIRPHRAQLTWRWAPAAETEAAFGFTFSRVKSLLVSEPNAVGPRVRVGFQIEELGPDSEFPVDRATNTFRYGTVLTTRLEGGRHQLTWGGDLLRYQLNGVETSSARGYYIFSSVGGRTAIDNLRLGIPAFYEVTLGEMARGFRNWGANAFVADKWKITNSVDISLGLRYNLVSGPTEVNSYHDQLFRCDCNNFSPRFSLAWKAGGGVVLRTFYTISFGDIPQVTYQQVRFNLPHVKYIQVQNPDLLDPLAGIDLDSPDLRSSPTYLAPDLVSPYTHQYGLHLEKRVFAGALLRVGYAGSKSLKMMNPYIQNRAEPVAGVPLTLATVDQRRPDPRYYEVRHVVNGGSGLLNAGQVSLDLPYWKGLRFTANYTLSKSIDDGADFTATAANRDMSRGRSQWQYEAFADRKGLSVFDSPHAFQANYAYDIPRLSSGEGWIRHLLNDWQVSGAVLAKAGTPVTLYIGSDAPGFGNVDGGPSDRPNIIDPWILGKTISHPDVATEILRRDRFAFITPGEHRGNLARSAFRKARIGNWNAAVTKQWVMAAAREWRVQLRGEVYNLTNTPQFDEPQRNLSSPSFGKITNALNDGRVFQLGLRLSM
jgi:hypothetical protein